MSSEPSKNPYTSTSTRYYAVGLLTIVYTFNFHRPPITVDSAGVHQGRFNAVGHTTGAADGVCICIVLCHRRHTPLPRWADRSNRRNIVALAVGIWSFMTALSGVVQNYFQLLLARVGVGVG